MINIKEVKNGTERFLVELKYCIVAVYCMHMNTEMNKVELKTFFAK